MLQNALKIGLIAVVLSVGVQNASAFGRWGCGWGCGSCCYAGCGWGGCCYTGCGYGGGGYAYGGWGYGSYYVGTGGYASPTAASTRAMASKAQAAADSVLLSVKVPADAKVFINGQPTNSVGESRTYTSKNLQASTVYDYRVRVEFVRDGKPVAEEQIAQLAPGQTGAFAFTATAESKVADVASAARR